MDIFSRPQELTSSKVFDVQYYKMKQYMPKITGNIKGYSTNGFTFGRTEVPVQVL